MNKVINITSNGIKQAIDDLVNENEMLQDKVYKLESIIKELEEKIYYLYNYAGLDTSDLGDELKKIKMIPKKEDNK